MHVYIYLKLCADRCRNLYFRDCRIVIGMEAMALFEPPGQWMGCYLSPTYKEPRSEGPVLCLGSAANG